MKKIILLILLLILAFCVMTTYKTKLKNELDNNKKEEFVSMSSDKDNNEKCSLASCGNTKLHPILDPKYNMREASKQCLLLEDHLNNTKKRCYDCIRKHFLVIDGLLEEAVSLEKNNDKRTYYRDLHSNWIKFEKKFSKNPNNSENLDDISKEIRTFRKPLVEKYFDEVSNYED
jgi:hypothetical protein